MTTLNLQDYALNNLGGVASKLQPTTVPTTIPTISGVNGPGAMQYNNGGQASMVPPTVPTVPAIPTVGTVMGTTPTVDRNTQLANLMAQAKGIQAQIPNATSTFNAPTPLDAVPDPWTPLTTQQERDIQRNQMQLFQKEIDATNQIYDQMLRVEDQQGQGRLGSVGSIGARAGILGSDFQNASEQNMQTQNNQLIGGIQAERAAKIAAIEGNGRQSAASEIAAKNLANKQGADAKIAFLASKAERKAANLSKLAGSLVDQGVDPTTMTAAEMKTITDSYGLSKEDIISEYNSAKVTQDAAAAKAKKDAEFSLSEGQARYDADGNLIASRAKTYAPTTSNKGILAGIPDATIETIRGTLESNRGSDNFTDTGKYLNEYKAFVSAGGTPEQFVKAFDPNKYINPSDPSKSWLESQMKKVSAIDPLTEFLTAYTANLAVNPAP